MPFIVQYILKLSLSLSLVYLFYEFVLRRLTFYNWNRFFLFAYTVLSFFIPLINITPVLERSEMLNNRIVAFIPSVNGINDARVAHRITDQMYTPVAWSLWDVASLIIVAGMIVLLLRLLVQFLSFRKMIRHSALVPGTGIRFYQVNKTIIPFSFGKSIFINPALHNEEELQEIVRHEFVHVKQKHTIDIIWAEALCILSWYNPFSWFIRRAIRQNLEFIADNKVLQGGVDKKQYQYLLLKVTGSDHFSIASQFNFSSLKNRIAMMNKMNSAKMHLIKFLFILPLIAVLLVAFRNNNGRNVQRERMRQTVAVNEQSFNTSRTDTVPQQDKYIIEVQVGQKKGSPTIIIVKDRKTKKVIKRMTLTEWDKNKAQNEKLYGPVDGVVEDKDHAALITTDDGRNVYAIQSDETDTVKFKRLELTDDNKVKILLKDGATENYDLDNKNEKRDFENKYGKILPGGKPAKVVIVADQTSRAAVASPARVIESTSFSIVRDDETTAAAPIVASPALAGRADVTQLADPAKMIVIEDNVIAIFRKNMQEADVKKIEADLKDRGYDFRITKAGYNNSGRLVLIRGHITKHNHKQYFNASDFSRLIITDSPENNDDDHFNFLVEQGRLSVNDSPDWQ